MFNCVPLELSEEDRGTLVEELARAQAEAVKARSAEGTRGLGINFHPHVFVTRNPLINLLQTRGAQAARLLTSAPPGTYVIASATLGAQAP